MGEHIRKTCSPDWAGSKKRPKSVTSSRALSVCSARGLANLVNGYELVSGFSCARTDNFAI